MKNKLSILLLTAALLFSPSCKVDEEKEQLYSKDPVDLAISTRASVNPTLPDSRVDRLRVLAFDAAGQCQSNELYDFKNSSLTSPFIHTMRPGLYTFVFIANEPTANTGTLSTIKIRSALNAVTFASSAFDRDDEIPMLKEYTGVEVLSSHKVKVGGIEYSQWTISLERLAVRLDLVLKSVVDWDGTFTGVKFENLPDYVPLFGNYAEATHSTQPAYTILDTALDDTDGIRDLTAAEIAAQVLLESDFTTKYAWSKKIDRIILPSCLFSPITNDTRALKFTILLGTHTPNTLIGHNKPSNYTLQRNTNYLGELDIERPEADLALELQAVNWDDVILNGNSYRQLNVSHIETLLSNAMGTMTTQRIYFWSNQEQVYVEESGYEETTGSTISVNNIFTYLGGSSAANLSYNSATGEGYIDVKVKSLTTGIYRLNLTAGGLKRELRITVKNFQQIQPAYLGTFHRAAETGERVIQIANTGTWSAQVVSGHDWIKLDTDGSGRTLPFGDDAEDNQVNGNATEVNGTGSIYFRVGMKSQLSASNPDYTTPPRYGLIEVWYQDKTKIHRIWVRQGEAADYVMAPDDADLGSAIISRTLAKKISPYNLTAPAMTNSTEYVVLAKNGGRWADYPSQAGAFFQFASAANPRFAYNPTFPSATIPASGWDQTAVDWSPDHETCPSNYRRPKIEDAIITSELGHSLASNLSLHPTDLQNQNSVLGYYADGFFDRRTIGTQTAFAGTQTNTAVAMDTKDIAYIGRLSFNPLETSSHYNAALFLPAAGHRSLQGYLYSTGYGNYSWSSDVVSLSGNGYSAVYFSPILVSFISTTYRSVASSVRCVVDE